MELLNRVSGWMHFCDAVMRNATSLEYSLNHIWTFYFLGTELCFSQTRHTVVFHSAGNELKPCSDAMLHLAAPC